MTWTPNSNPEFAKPLIRQLLALIQRDQRAALDWVGGDGVLPDIASYQLAPLSLPQFPYVLLYSDEHVFSQEAVGSREYTTRLICEVATVHQDFQALAETVQDYVRAIDLILDTIPFSDFYQGWPLTLPMLGKTPVQTAPLQYGSVKELFVARHRIGRVGKANTGFAGSAILEFQIDREEI